MTVQQRVHVCFLPFPAELLPLSAVEGRPGLKACCPGAAYSRFTRLPVEKIIGVSFYRCTIFPLASMSPEWLASGSGTGEKFSTQDVAGRVKTDRIKVSLWSILLFLCCDCCPTAWKAGHLIYTPHPHSYILAEFEGCLLGAVPLYAPFVRLLLFIFPVDWHSEMHGICCCVAHRLRRGPLCATASVLRWEQVVGENSSGPCGPMYLR